MFADIFNKMSRRTKRFILLGIILIILAIVAIFIYRAVAYSAIINLTFAPQSATAKIGSANAKFGANKVKPGTYEIKITKSGFNDYSTRVTVKAGDSIEVKAALTPNSPDTADWYSKNPEDYSVSQTINDQSYDAGQEKMLKDFPVAAVLPIVSDYGSYRVDYGVSPTKQGQSAIYITYLGEDDKQAALDAIRNKGYNPDDYEIVYKPQNSPSGAPAVSGLNILLQRGLDNTTVLYVQDALVATFRDNAVKKISLSTDLTHSLSEDKVINTYTIPMTFNDNEQKLLTIEMNRSSGTTSVFVSGANGSDREQIEAYDY